MWTKNFQMFTWIQKRQRNQRSNCQHLLNHRKSKRIPEKHLLLLYDCVKLLTVWITTNCGKFLKRWEYQTSLPVSWESCMQVKKQQLESDREQRTGSKLGKEYTKAVYCCIHSAYLTSMQSTSCEMRGWMNHKLESRLLGEISSPQICRWYHSSGRKWRGTKEPLDEGERGQRKSWFKTQHSKKQRPWHLHRK